MFVYSAVSHKTTDKVRQTLSPEAKICNDEVKCPPTKQPYR